jgi:di/tricarboxylate transporter
MHPLIITWLVLGVAILLLLSDRLRPDLVALMVIVTLGVTGVLTPQESFSGFSRSAVITLLAVFILAEGLQRTGVTDRVGVLLVKAAGRSEGRLTITVMLAGAFLSLFMNNIAAAAVLLPAVSGAARKAKANPSKLLMPLAFGTILGGMATLFTSNNLVVSSLLRDHGLDGYGVLDFAPLGLPLVLCGVIYMAILGWRWLPSEPPIQRLLGEMVDDLADIYRLGERLIQVRIPDDSPLAGVPLAQSRLREAYNLNVVGVKHNGSWRYSPMPQTILQHGDILLLEGKLEELEGKNGGDLFEILPAANWSLEAPGSALVEMALAPRSRFIGQTLRQAHFREKYQMAVLGIWRSGRPFRTGLSDLPLQFGDALLLQGPGTQIPILQSDPEFIVLAQRVEAQTANGRKALPAVLVMVATLALVIAYPSAIAEILMGGALVMVLLGALTMDQAYQAIDWKSIFMVAGMLPLGIALTKTGAASDLVNQIIYLSGSINQMALLAGIFVAAMLLTQFINNAAVAAIMTPIVIELAQHTGLNPRALVMGLAMAISMTFLTPFAHPVNVLVMGPGGYRSRDYLKVGLLLTMLLLVVLLTLLPLIWPITP